MRRRTAFLLATLVGLLATLPAAPPALAEPVAAIGRFNHAGFRKMSHCTATVIAPGRAVTAAHCLPVSGTAGNAHFLPGLNSDGWIEALALAHWGIDGGDRDVALLCLSPPGRTPPMPRSATGPQTGETLTIIGYGQPRKHAQSRLDCAVATIGPHGAFTLACPMRPGMSGSPVMRETPAGREIVGVISATGQDRSRAYDISGDTVLPACE
jgi:protease YdgD